MQNLIFKGLNGEFKIAATTQYITRIKDSTNNHLKYTVTSSPTPKFNPSVFVLPVIYFHIFHFTNSTVVTLSVWRPTNTGNCIYSYLSTVIVCPSTIIQKLSYMPT